MAGIGRIAPWLLGIAIAIPAGAGYAQKNIDAERTPAQLFSDGCTVCHTSPYVLKQTSAEFLRSHYTTGMRQATAMAAYLDQVRKEPPPIKQRRPSASLEETKAIAGPVSETEVETMTSELEGFEE